MSSDARVEARARDQSGWTVHVIRADGSQAAFWTATTLEQLHTALDRAAAARRRVPVTNAIPAEPAPARTGRRP